MFESRKPRPIIIISETEKIAAPETAKTWWEKHYSIVNFIVAVCCGIILISIVIILVQIKNQSLKTASSIQQDVVLNNLKYQELLEQRFNDSVSMAYKFKLQDSITSVYFRNMAIKMQMLEKKNLLLEKKYQQQVEFK